MAKYEVVFVVSVEVEINNPDVLRRVLENTDDEGNPVPFDSSRRPSMEEPRGWRHTFFPSLDSEEKIVTHLAGLAIRGLDIGNMEGWQDLATDWGSCGPVVQAARFDTDTETIGYYKYE